MMNSIKILLTIAANEDLEVHHVDVTTAFVIPDLEEEVYMLPPTGYRDLREVWRLNKSIYGLKQVYQSLGIRIERDRAQRTVHIS